MNHDPITELLDLAILLHPQVSTWVYTHQEESETLVRSVQAAHPRTRPSDQARSLALAIHVTERLGLDCALEAL
jgi:hypothetical protein